VHDLSTCLLENTDSPGFSSGDVITKRIPALDPAFFRFSCCCWEELEMLGSCLTLQKADHSFGRRFALKKSLQSIKPLDRSVLCFLYYAIHRRAKTA
jgi:hypothetical protein